jgi:hypothetical protein
MYIVSTSIVYGCRSICTFLYLFISNNHGCKTSHVIRKPRQCPGGMSCGIVYTWDHMGREIESVVVSDVLSTYYVYIRETKLVTL